MHASLQRTPSLLAGASDLGQLCLALIDLGFEVLDFPVDLRPGVGCGDSRLGSELLDIGLPDFQMGLGFLQKGCFLTHALFSDQQSIAPRARGTIRRTDAP